MRLRYLRTRNGPYWCTKTDSDTLPTPKGIRTSNKHAVKRNCKGSIINNAIKIAVESFGFIRIDRRVND